MTSGFATNTRKQLNLNFETEMEEDSQTFLGNLSELDLAAENFLELFKNQEEEVQNLNQRSQKLEAEVEALKTAIRNLESEKSDIDADVTKLRLRNIAFQKEHANLRNSITVIKFHIEKIKESIAKAKATDLKNLEDFEKAVDEITERFRSGPNIYDRKVLMENIEKEKEKKDNLNKKLDEVRSMYETFCKEKGLRVRKDENEDLLNCILPGSELFYLMEMTKTLNDVTCGIKKLTEA